MHLYAYLKKTFLSVCLVYLLSSAEVSQALKCYQCGSYPRGGGTGSISPCSDQDDKNVMTCSPLDKMCLKYVNKKMVVRQCSEKCDDAKNSHEEEYHCCKDDLCNGGFIVGPKWFTIIFAAIISLTLTYRA